MSTIHVPSINPKIRYVGHPEAIKSNFQTSNDQSFHPNKQKNLSKPTNEGLPKHDTRQIIKRVNAQDIIGKQSLMEFLNQKRLNKYVQSMHATMDSMVQLKLYKLSRK